jgi:hypothetical protein
MFLREVIQSIRAAIEKPYTWPGEGDIMAVQPVYTTRTWRKAILGDGGIGEYVMTAISQAARKLYMGGFTSPNTIQSGVSPIPVLERYWTIKGEPHGSSPRERMVSPQQFR